MAVKHGDFQFPKSFGFGGSAGAPIAPHPMGNQPSRVEKRFDGSTVIHHQHGGKTVNHLGGMTTHHKKTGTMIRPEMPDAQPAAMVPQGMAPDGAVADPSMGAPMRNGGRVGFAKGGAVNSDRKADVKLIKQMIAAEERKEGRVKKADGGAVDDDSGMVGHAPEYTRQRSVYGRGAAAVSAVKGKAARARGANDTAALYDKLGDLTSGSAERSERRPLPDYAPDQDNLQPGYARGGRIRLPRGMKPTAAQSHSPINTAPRNPQVTRTPTNDMAGGVMPYGVMPSDEPGYRKTSPTGATPDAYKKGGKVRRRPFDDGGAVDNDSNYAESMRRSMGNNVSDANPRSTPAPSSSASNAAASDFATSPPPPEKAASGYPGTPVKLSGVTVNSSTKYGPLPGDQIGNVDGPALRDVQSLLAGNPPAYRKGGKVRGQK